MKKKLTIAIVTVMLFASLIGTVAATTGTVTRELEYHDIKVTLNGNDLDLRDVNGNSVEPFMFDGTNYLPVRVVAEALGLNVGWDGNTSTILLTSPQATYITRTGSKYHYDPHCNGGTYWEVPYETAVGMGLGPCNKCVQ